MNDREIGELDDAGVLAIAENALGELHRRLTGAPDVDEEQQDLIERACDAFDELAALMRGIEEETHG